MRKNDSFEAALYTMALLVVGALVALLAVVTLRDLGWDVSGCDAFTKLGVALGLFLGCLLLGSALYRISTWLRVRRVMFLRVMNARIRGSFFDDVAYSDFRDLPRRWRREVRREFRHSGGVVRDTDWPRFKFNLIKKIRL